MGTMTAAAEWMTVEATRVERRPRAGLVGEWVPVPLVPEAPEPRPEQAERWWLSGVDVLE